jgi:hypothetical protein
MKPALGSKRYGTLETTLRQHLPKGLLNPEDCGPVSTDNHILTRSSG